MRGYDYSRKIDYAVQEYIASEPRRCLVVNTSTLYEINTGSIFEFVRVYVMFTRFVVENFPFLSVF